MLGLPLVIQGIPNHMKAIRATAPATSHRMDGILSQAHTMWQPRNGQTSGRPSDPSTPNTSAHR